MLSVAGGVGLLVAGGLGLLVSGLGVRLLMDRLSISLRLLGG